MKLKDLVMEYYGSYEFKHVKEETKNNTYIFLV